MTRVRADECVCAMGYTRSGSAARETKADVEGYRVAAMERRDKDGEKTRKVMVISFAQETFELRGSIFL